MSLIKKVILACFFSLFSLTVAAENEGTSSLENFLEGLETFEGDFKQSLMNAKGNIVDRSSGKLYMKNPGKFHWVYQDPYPQRIVTNGKLLWFYDEDLDQVTIKDVSEEINQSPAAILSGAENLNEYFDIVDKGKVEGVYIIELHPLNPKNQFHKVEIGFYGRFLHMMMMFDKLGQITRVNFSDTKRNIPLKDSFFEFEAPEGADIIDSREEPKAEAIAVEEMALETETKTETEEADLEW